MSDPSRAQLRHLVYDRANGICEYCRTSEANTGQTMQVDHIDPQGGDSPDNLCLACMNCNASKHKATTALDPITQANVPLYNPRIQVWSEHFEWINDATLVHGLTPTGRATVARLRVNRPMMISARQRWVELRHHPPD
ncbi:MAG: HNH endonuclease [Chloroflexi bacterium]|nr:HNH endonuclease [Chloroflexota bacterium]